MAIDNTWICARCGFNVLSENTGFTFSNRRVQSCERCPKTEPHSKAYSQPTPIPPKVGLELLYVRGMKIICRTCSAHVGTFRLNLYAGDPVVSEIFEKDAGQAPWVNGEELRCRKCGTPFFHGGFLKSKKVSGG